jgi:hypothetical protein
MIAQLSPIEAHERTIGQIFDDTYAFEIPAYQRPYAWEIDQARELLVDLLDAMQNKETSGGVYFLGSIVLIKSPSDPISRIIDGQQRLTTLTILLSVLRDLTTDEDKKFDRRRYVFQKANADRGTSDRFRVLLRPQDRPFFLKCVQQPGATNSLPDVESLEGSHYRIAANARYLRSQLELLDESKRDALIAFIIQHCYLVVVAVPTAEAARRIFTVLNARGLDLTPTDILKADLLDRAGDAEVTLARRWESIEVETGREGMVELFGHIRMLYEREKPRTALESAFPKAVAPFRGDADQFVSDILEPIANAFSQLKNNDIIQQRFGPEAAKAVRSLMRIDNKDWVAPALLRLWKRTSGDAEGVATFLVALERVAYFLFVTRKGVNERIARFVSIMNEIDPQGDRREIGLTLAETEQAEFIEELNGNIYQKTRICKPVLQRLDEALSSGGAHYDELVSIEHVLPQTVENGSEWAALYPDELRRSEWTHRLANLVFLTHRVNTRASNWDFETKKTRYFGAEDGSSPFVITQDVLRTERWTLEHLAERQQRLLKKLADVWDLDLTKIQSYDVAMENYPTKGMRDITDARLIEAKREAILRALCYREGFQLIKKSGALYATTDGNVRAVCTISKRYPTGSPYWFGYSPQWDEFLSGGKTSFLVLGAMDRDSAYAIPHERLSSILRHLNRTGERHWHIMLEENEAGQIDLAVPKTGSKIGLIEFEIKQNQ